MTLWEVSKWPLKEPVAVEYGTIYSYINFVRVNVSSTLGEWLVCLTWESDCCWTRIIYYLQNIFQLYSLTKSPTPSNDCNFMFGWIAVGQAKKISSVWDVFLCCVMLCYVTSIKCYMWYQSSVHCLECTQIVGLKI